MISTEPVKEKAVLVGLINSRQDERKINEYLDELAFLVESADAVPEKKFIQRVEVPNPKTYIGEGKANEIAAYIKDNKIALAIFDDELSSSQLRNLEKLFQCAVLDRTNIILNIFARRARTSYSKAQVELAQYEYMLPRLKHLWTHLSKQKGGIGMRGGPGEQEIETDRRIVRDKIAALKEKLKNIDKQMAVQRKNRTELVRVALVGYTNVGKSTIMNLLAKSDILTENKLFATLDTTVRKVVVNNLPVLVSDTVGFIRKLPHQLVESFKSTLDEVREADILLHIVDISHPAYEEQIDIVNSTLAEINANDKIIILVFNKIDLYSFEKKDADDLSPPTEKNISYDELRNLWIAKSNEPCIFISAKNKINFNLLRETIYKFAAKIHSERFPYNNFLY
ncbi:MAG: GTPase HflX [Bacteroidales bacterium]|nr:GTPase HflX [Bacteroidales bacterium]